MNEEQKLRLEALKIFQRVSRSRRYVRHLARTSGTRETVNVVAVLNTDRVHYAEELVRRAGGEAEVVVYWPAEDRINVAHVNNKTIARESVFGVDPVDVHEDANVEMLLTLIQQTGRSVYTVSRAEVMA